MARRPSFEEELAALDGVARTPRSEEARARLDAALASKRSLVVARAARLIKEHAVAGFERALTDAFARFLVDPVKSDPVCQAKVAAIEALDYGESDDAEPFLRAVRHVQLEGGTDSAAPLRARAVLALARLGHPDFDLVAATLLGDPIANVRQATLDALAHRGDRACAALAMAKLATGDAEPEVVLAAMTALLDLIRNAAPPDARTAIESLAPRRFEPNVADRVRQAANDNDRGDLTPLVDDVFR